MSIRAHKIIEIKHEGESFNLSHDGKFMEYLEKHSEFIIDQRRYYCGKYPDTSLLFSLLY